MTHASQMKQKTVLGPVYNMPLSSKNGMKMFSYENGKVQTGP